MLADRWRALVPDRPELGADLIARWSQPHRRYHTVQHLTAVLDVVDRYANLAADPDAVRLAVWFHDAVYDPAAPDNEERSAQVAEATLPDPGEVARLVRLTAGHQVAPGDANGALLADADLSVLAAAPRDYDRYAAAVRAEYAHVPDEVFRTGRAAILRDLADRPALYRIVPPRAEWHARAVDNLRRELRALAG
jgi:predicted metal-dependent HD superfamily phosphohydrolase